MTLKDLVSKLRIKTNIELLENDIFLCNTISDSKVLDVYGEREIINWFTKNFTGSYDVYVSINIKGENEE